MMPKYFDIHSHLQFSGFDEDMAEVLGRMREEGVSTIVVGTDKESSQKACDMISVDRACLKTSFRLKSEDFATKAGFQTCSSGIFAAVGLHPNDVLKEEFSTSFYKSLAQKEGVVAIGECGIDYFRIKNQELRIRQKKVFEQHVQLAVDLDLPLMLHCRSTSGTTDAYDDALEILNSYFLIHNSKLRGNAHFFTSSLHIAKKFLDIGFTISFPGVITFTSDYDDVVRGLPLESILSETDCPFAAPVPYRGQRNEPVYVKEVVKKIAEIRGEDFEKVREAMIINTRRVFGV